MGCLENLQSKQALIYLWIVIDVPPALDPNTVACFHCIEANTEAVVPPQQERGQTYLSLSFALVLMANSAQFPNHWSVIEITRYATAA